MSKFSRFISLLLTAIMLIGSCVFQMPVSAAESCTITFDANGGTGMPANVTVNAGTIINLPASAPKRPGMEFMGWAFSKDAADRGEITYAANTTPEILVNNSAILYASWAYKVTLNPGTQGWGATQILYKFPSVDLSLFHHKSDIHTNYGMLPGVAGDVSRLDVFVEWNTNQLPNGKGNGTAYHEAYTTNAPATLYAVWGNPIVYNADGGIFPMTGTDIQEEFVVGHSDTLTDSTKFGYFNLPGLENSPIKAGARLLTDANGETVYARVFTNGTVYRLENHDTWLEIPIFNSSGYSWDAFYTTHTTYGECALELYAIWEPSVTYKANGGKGKDVIEYMTFAGDALYSYNDYTVLDNGFTNNADFLGWNTKPDGTGTSYAAGDVITDYDNSNPLVLYAQWNNAVSDTKEYTVSFNAMEGYLAFEDQSRKITYGESYAAAMDIPVPTNPGYIFKGWYNEETGSYLMDNEIYSLNRDTSFTAKYELHGHHVLDCFKKEANCWYEGYYTTSCKGCGFYDTIVYEKTPHSFGNWITTDTNGAVKRVCSACLGEEGADYTTMIQQDVIAYVNRSGNFGNSDFQYVDVANYIGAVIDGGVGESVFQGDYFANAVSIKNRARSYNPNIKYVLTVYNGSIAKFEGWLQSASTRAAFADTLVNTVYAYGFDGLDIDYEFPQDLTLKDDFVMLLADIRSRFNVKTAQTGKQYLLTIATPASIWSYQKFDLPGCAAYLDYFNIMNYDLYCGSAFPYTHHHTPPYDNVDPFGHIATGGSVQSDITLYKSLGIPAEKIVAGMGLYSREWTGVANYNNGLFMAGTLQESNFHYDQLVSSYINRNGFTRYWDDNSKAPYLYNPSSGIFLSYEDPDSIRYKCEIVERERIRGVMVFDYITCDSIGIFEYINDQIGSVPHSCTPGRVESKYLTCAENGQEIIHCVLCDAVMSHTEIYHEGHYCELWEITSPATSTTAGVLSGTCLFCSETITKQIEPLGYTVTLDPNGGSINSSTQYIVQNAETFHAAFGGIPAATKEGKEFTGWYCKEKNYTLNISDCYTFGSDMTFVAQWAEDEHVHSYTSAVTKEATCTENGIITYSCSCGDSYTEEITAKGHSYGEWYTVTEPTATSTGEERRDCENCDAYETNELPMIEAEGEEPILTTDGYNIMLTKADTFTYIRYAKGEYATASEIKAASDCVTLNAAKIASFTENGMVTLEMTDGGIYSLWIKDSDGNEYVYRADLTQMDQYVTAYGVTMTVHNLYGVKDFFIAPGDYDTYADVKANYLVMISSTKINGAHDYTYLVPNPGMHTVYIRYEDTARPATILKIMLEVTEPTFAENGLQFTVGNLDDVKVIRTAYGEYSTPGEVKRAEGARGFSGKDRSLKDKSEFTIQYRTNGMVTVAVVYNNGYQVIYHYDVQQKVPTFVQSGNTVTIGDLDGLNLIRYAKGEYTTSNQIKNAKDSMVVKDDAAIDGFITVKLDAGIYTFCVQYLDESYNYYTVTVN